MDTAVRAQVAPPTAPEPTRQTLIIVGNGMTSFRLCQELVESGAIAELHVIVVGQERVPAYDRVRLTALLSDATVDDLVFASEEWYAECGIELILGETVVAIDRADCLVRTDTGRELLYDRLVLATGSAPFVPPVPGTDRPGVFVYRTVDDVQAIRAWGAGRRRAVVVGGGLLGLEAAKAVRDLGLETVVVEGAAGLMSRQLDADGSRRLSQEIVKLGVEVHAGRRLCGIEAASERHRLQFADGELEADLIILAAGIRPASGLAQAAGLTLDERGGGVAVDDGLMTSDDRIFAIGECASHGGAAYGLVAPGYQMVRVLVANLGGGRAAFRAQVPPVKLKLLGVSVSSVGEHTDATPGTLGLRFESVEVYRKVLIRGGRLVGALAVGAWPGFDRVAQGVARHTRVTPWELRRFRTRGELWGLAGSTSAASWPADAIVCACLQVTRGRIDAARAGGCEDVAAVCAATGAGSACGSCKPLIAELVPLRGLIRPSGQTRSVRTSGPVRVSASHAVVTPSSISGRHAVLTSSSDSHRPAAPRRTTMPPFRAVTVSSPSLSAITPVPETRERGAILLVCASVAALALVALLLCGPSFAAAVAVRTTKLVTGYAAVALALASMALTLRKRWRRLRHLDVGPWRAAHGVLAAAATAVAALHTGLHLGVNLNRALVVDWLAAVVLGVAAAAVYAGSHRLSPLVARDQRRLWARAHLVVLAPLPVLLILHILAAYYY